MKIDEKSIDSAIENAFKTSENFCTWILGHTKFAKKNMSYHWSRSDHPWGKVTAELVNPDSNTIQTITRECETDILVVFEDLNENSKVAIHIENKLANGKFEEYQPELYGPRAKQWIGLPKYKSYTDFATILIAPKSFHDKNLARSNTFDSFISYEELAQHVELINRYMCDLHNRAA